MRILLDACTCLWIALDSPDLSPAARDRVEDAGNEVLLSAVSVWEIVIKYAMGKLDLPRPPEELIPEMRERQGIESLMLDEEAVLGVRRLPALHKDPFDRMLVSQAITHGLTILTPDLLIRQYPARTMW